jgi:DNA-binding GntR family transcriptional regulator
MAESAGWTRGADLRRRSLGDEVAETLRNMILVGDLKSPEKLTQDKVAERLGVSTTPVREGLLKLAAEGFVEAQRNRSFRVLPATRQDVSDTYWSHAVLAGELAARACAQKDQALVDRLDLLHQRVSAAAVQGAPEAMEEANDDFHRTINRAAESPRLLLLLRATLRFIPDHFYALLPEWPPVSERGHGAILEAFEAGDPEAARTAAAQHVRDAEKLLMEHFSDTGYWTPPDTERVNGR